MSELTQSTMTRKAYTHFDALSRRLFLEELALTGSFIGACDVAHISRATAYNARKNEPEFDEACEEALERYRKRIVDEVHRRGVIGVEEPIYQGGQLVGHKQVYSDKLLELLVKTKVAEFKDKPAEVIVNNQTLNVNVSLETLSQDARAALRQAAEALRAAQPVLDVPSDPQDEDDE